MAYSSCKWASNICDWVWKSICLFRPNLPTLKLETCFNPWHILFLLLIFECVGFLSCAVCVLSRWRAAGGRVFALRGDTALCTACSRSEFLEAYKSCWMRWRAWDRNDGRDGGVRGGGALGSVGGVSSSHLQAWLNNRMLYENKNIICLLKGRERPSNWLPPRLRGNAHHV